MVRTLVLLLTISSLALARGHETVFEEEGLVEREFKRCCCYPVIPRPLTQDEKQKAKLEYFPATYTGITSNRNTVGCNAWCNELGTRDKVALQWSLCEEGFSCPSNAKDYKEHCW